MAAMVTWPRWERLAQEFSPVRDGLSGSRRSTGTMQSCGRELVGGGESTTMNFTGDRRLAGGGAERRRSSGRIWPRKLLRVRAR